MCHFKSHSSFKPTFLAEKSRKGKGLEVAVHDIDEKQDQDIARLKLRTMGIKIDSLTKEQIDYMDDYSAGT